MKTQRTKYAHLIVGLAIGFFSSSLALHAQTMSTIRGTVADGTGAVVPGAEVTVTEVQTQVTVRTVTSNAGGDYEVPDVVPGVYRVTAALDGFKTFVADNIIVEGSQIRRVDVSLEIGELTETVTVEAGATPITTDTAAISSQVKRQLYDQTPLVRNYYPHSVLVTLPGVESQGSGWRLRINGTNPSQAAMGMDGVTNDNTVNLVNRLDFSEINVVGVSATAEYARPANYNMVSKRGFNDFHGEVWYTHYNSALVARKFFDPVKPHEKEHRTQFQVSGPIIKNRTFFYVSYFYLSLPAGSFRRESVPTLQMRQGDFSQLSTPVKDPLTGNLFPNRMIPASRFSQVPLNIQQAYIPEPNLGGPDDLVSNFGFIHPFPNDLFEARYPQYRIDHNITENNQIYGRWIRRRTPYVLARGLPGFTWTRIRSHTATVLTDTHVFSPNLVNSFRFGLKTDFVEDGLTTAGVDPIKADDAIAVMGLEGVNQGNYQDRQGAPRIDITGLTSLQTIGGGVAQNDNQYNYANTLSWSVGRHVLKVGGELKVYDRFGGAVRDPAYGRFGFNGSLSDAPYGDFLLGLPFKSERSNPLVNRVRNVKEFGIFVTDTFKVTPKLTLDLGLRLDYFPSASYEDGLQYAWDPSSGNLIVPQDKLSAVSSLYPKTITVVEGNVLPEAKTSNVRPRLGFAYRLRDKTVVRGGYGMFTETVGYFRRLQGGGPFSLSETYFNSVENGNPLFAFPNAFPASLASATVSSQSISAYPTRTNNGTIHQYSLSVEQQVGDIGFRISYIGSRSRGLNYNLNINKPEPSLIPFTIARRPYPQFVNVTMAQEDGRSDYNSFQFRVNRKVGTITFDAHYTLQSSMSDFLNLENPYSHRFFNREAFSARHKAVISAVIDLPFGTGQRYLSGAPGVVNNVVGGWRLIPITIFQSGQFFNPTFSGSDPSSTNSFGGLPDRICDGNLGGQRSIERWFDPACFTAPPPGRFGNSGVNVLERPGLNLIHLAIVKQFNLSERFKLEWVAGMSNLFNHPHFRPPRSNISAADPGRITSILTGADLSMEKTRSREIEFTLRLKW